MAQPHLASRPDTGSQPMPLEEQVFLRAIKNQLQARFPTVKSSHLTEAIASGFGFNSHAALKAATTRADGWDNPTSKAFDAGAFKGRLMQLDYPILPGYRLEDGTTDASPPARYREWLAELKLLEKNPDKVWPRIFALRKRCAAEFASTFSLGQVKSPHEEDAGEVMRWKTGVDRACIPGWGQHVNSRQGGYIDFPGSDHRWWFYEDLQSPGGPAKHIQYCSAMVSLPYVNEQGKPRHLAEATEMAGQVGWSCSLHPEWSWYGLGSTTLVLFKRMTPSTELRAAWPTSFKRWVLENEERLASFSHTTTQVAEDIAACQHVPLDLKDFDDCSRRYLKEFVPALYRNPENEFAVAFEALMALWQRDIADGAWPAA